MVGATCEGSEGIALKPAICGHHLKRLPGKHCGEFGTLSWTYLLVASQAHMSFKSWLSDLHGGNMVDD